MAEYIHGTAPSEQARLALLNRLTNATFVGFLRPEPGMRVLEVGSGLGLLAAEVASSAAGVHVTGLERSPAQIAAAAAHSRVTYIHGDAHQLDFPDASFDLVYARYLLEHVGDPERVVREMRRVARPGGRVAACENDISLLRLDPPCPTFDRVWTAFADYQRRLGGDAYVGRRLYRLFRSGGFSDVELSIQPEVHWHGSPGFTATIENTIGNVESGREGMIETGSSDEAAIIRAIAELRGLLTSPDGSSLFSWNRATAVR
jgi:SAM-dependent methyltransferase